LLVFLFSFGLGYRIAPQSLTVSGFQAGGFFAVQYHVVFSSNVSGAAVLCGGPYWCAKGNDTIAQTSCSTDPNSINIADLVTHTSREASKELIDPPSNLNNSKVWLYSGLNDTIIVQGVVQKLGQYYLNYIPKDNIEVVFDHLAEDAFPTLNYGNSPCTFLGPNYINKCQYDPAGALFKFLYGKLNNPTSPNVNSLKTVDQSNFVPPPQTLEDASFQDIAYLYVPTDCQNGTVQCKLHVVFHGCSQTLDTLNTTFVQNTGYNTWAESNNIIVLYPQVKAKEHNPDGCFDYYGYSGSTYASREGIQIQTVRNMVNSLYE